MKTLFQFTFSIIALGLLASCATPAQPAPTPLPPVAPTVIVPQTVVVTPIPAPTRASQPTPTSAPQPTALNAAGAGAQVPSSCNAIVSLVGAYMGGVANIKSLGTPQHLSCEFGNANASTIIIVNIGVGGTAANFDALRATSAQGGRTVTPLSGLGSSAFSVSKNGVPGGVSVLTAQGLVYVVESNLPIAQDETLIEQLMKLP